MSVTIRPNDDVLNWYGAVSLECADGWAMPWRIPHEERSLFPPEAMVERAACSSGVRLAFRSDTRSVAGRIVPVEGLGRLDLCCDGEMAGSQPMAGRDAFLFDSLPDGERDIELWLPTNGPLRLKSLTLSEGASIAQFCDPRPRWVTYGSSITHCSGAESPTQTWPAIVARARGLNLTSLGYGGNCHLDSMVARMMRELPADYLSMCVGINVYGGASLGPRTFRAGIIGFIKIVRERHADAPFVVMSPTISPPRESTPNAVGFTLEQMREEIADAVNRLRDMGDANLHYVDGLDVFGREQSAMLPDGVHPSPEGYKELGRRFAEKVAAKYFA